MGFYSDNIATKVAHIDYLGNIHTEGLVNTSKSYYVNGTIGLTQAISVRKGDDSGACTLTFTGGILTGSTC